MKKKWWMTLGLVAAVVGLAACQTNEKDSTVAKQDASWEKVEERGRLIVATSGTLFPASYYNDKNELTGYDVEVAKEVANRLKLDIEFQEYNVDGMLASVEKGMTDLVANDFGMSEERSKKFALSIPIKYSFDSMIVRKEDNSGIASLEDLKGKKAAGEATTGYMKLAEKMGAELVSYDNATNDQYLTDVANGRTDVILNDYYLQKMSVAALPNIPVKILEDVYFNPSSSGFFYPKQNVALREKIDTVLEEMQADGSLKKLSETFFNADVSVEPDVKVDKTVTID
ncbi:transporter substrate-binding domain-containing protein [Vagococcus lutrae]|uniref:transporter substrate-binding domain-containing protein n=1 Tax=Vagococcus lutrae TaxID=81947 RepID=UPI001C96497B|nr:transporter substrate-binding domain-containing protein [Vagococcus lutrae]MDO5741746.1 transporter substrate-binding domain-containing protein [Vagococcus sp.]MDT2811463.1 transporter substrate-binding domain-containing protein [Vagococcus lutrae]MDT2819051.1 transporter substrate-binding domain-containing protein [Vagococcus lutrae]MDT2843992.1 transporter substrate-binding domain-containing protein [Vagococcus lutrae]QZN89516.1 transporter substrate-binding domain-containing protein [Vag